MVEFGLKLEDNKVAEWAQYYIDYEKLKSLLKKAKASRTKTESLTKRDPQLAAEIKSAYEDGTYTSSKFNSRAGTPTMSESSMVELEERESVKKGELQSLVSSDGLKDNDNYGSKQSLEDVEKPPAPSTMRRSLSASELSLTVLQSAMSGVTGYFQRNNYPNKLRDSIKETDKGLQSFSRCFYDELDKVTQFHKETFTDIEKRLEDLVDSVGTDHRTKSLISPDDHQSSLYTKVRQASQIIFHHPKKDVHLIDGEESDQEEAGGHGSRRHDSILKNIRESDSIKRALTDLYRRVKLLNNYAIMNYTGFIKIEKKFNKTFPDHKNEFKHIFEDHMLSEGKETERLTEQMENLFATWFCSDNIREARAQMLPKKGDGLQMDWSQLRLGYRLGMCSILALWVCWDCIWGLVHKGTSTIGGRTAFPVFRACGGLLLYHWFWGFSVFIWSRYRINYIFLFDFDPRIVATPIMIFNDCVDETLVFLMLMLLYYKSGAHDIPDFIPPGSYPFILVMYTIKKLIVPWRTRAPLWRSMWECATAPITSPTFFTNYVADVFTSMVKVFQDLMWTTCFVMSGDFLLSEEDTNDVQPHDWQHRFWYKNVVIPMICLFPLWIRFNQCLRRYYDTGVRWPNLANAFKYAMSQTVTLFGAFHPLYMLYNHNEHIHQLDMAEYQQTGHTQKVSVMDVFQVFWMGLFVTSSLYSFFWDVYMDWGLGRPQYAFLGPRLMYPKRIHYYGVIFADLFLRFMWVLTLIPPQSGARFEVPNYLTAMTMSVELLRRTLWGFFRLEHEHRHNTLGYRRVDFVPLHFRTGHEHKYESGQDHVGWNVLAEVMAVSIAVIAVSISSVIAAQRATHYAQESP